jgi:peptidoglycan hydrolase-like protein with peptidoglycan-binding domain
VRSLLVTVEGQVPGPSAFPPYDLSRPLTRADIAPPKSKLPPHPQTRLKPPSPAIKKLQRRLADLSFLPATDIDGRAGPETTFAATAFQKWAGLSRDGVAWPAARSELIQDPGNRALTSRRRRCLLR